MAVREVTEMEDVVQEIDRLIAEMTLLRSRAVSLSVTERPPRQSIREGEYFGMWADREDMQGISSREWLENLRATR